MRKMKTIVWVIVLCLVASTGFAACAEGEKMDTERFKAMIRDRVLSILYAWPADDQYAIMFFIYPNESYEYRGYSNIPEFQMNYRCESDLLENNNPFFDPVDEDENRWNPAFWDDDTLASVIGFDEPNAMADALIDWYETIGVENIGLEAEDTVYDENSVYIGKGPNGLPELLQIISEVAAELQNDGTIENRFGRKIPVILADFEFTWYMIRATQNANPNGEAEGYIESCIRQGYIREQ